MKNPCRFSLLNYKAYVSYLVDSTWLSFIHIEFVKKSASERVALEFLNRKLDIVDPGIELTTANYMSLPE